VRNFWASDQSVVAVEFAVVAPAFLFLICVSLETFRIQVARVIVQRAIYSMAYEAKTAKDRDADFGAMAAAIIERLRNKMVFAANEVEVKFYSSPTFDGVVDHKTASAGAGDVEHIALF
jgi:Flp pilus assembly protein TadG